MEPEGSMPHRQGFSIIHILGRINPISRIFTYFFKIISNIILSSTPRPSYNLWVYLLKSWKHSYLLPIWLHDMTITTLKI